MSSAHCLYVHHKSQLSAHIFFFRSPPWTARALPEDGKLTACRVGRHTTSRRAVGVCAYILPQTRVGHAARARGDRAVGIVRRRLLGGLRGPGPDGGGGEGQGREGEEGGEAGELHFRTCFPRLSEFIMRKNMVYLIRLVLSKEGEGSRVDRIDWRVARQRLGRSEGQPPAREPENCSLDIYTQDTQPCQASSFCGFAPARRIFRGLRLLQGDRFVII